MSDLDRHGSRRQRLLALALVVVAALSACGTDDQPSGEPASDANVATGDGASSSVTAAGDEAVTSVDSPTTVASGGQSSAIDTTAEGDDSGTTAATAGDVGTTSVETTTTVAGADQANTTATTERAAKVTTSTGATAAGVIAVHIEPVEGFFIEGFEVGLRFETVSGSVIAATLWSDFVESQGEQSIDAYYNSVLEQSVPAGRIVVLATVNVGAGPPPVVPDLQGNLRCRLLVQVPQGGQVDIEVGFSSRNNCLRAL